MHLKSPCHLADLGKWLVFEVFRHLEVKSTEESLLGKIPNFAIAATEAVFQPCNTQWGKSLQSNGNKTAFSPEINVALQVLVDKSVPLYVREQAAL